MGSRAIGSLALKDSSRATLSLPYLFIIVANLLHRMIHEACAAGYLHLPLCDATSCPVLQYTNDTQRHP